MSDPTNRIKKINKISSIDEMLNIIECDDIIVFCVWLDCPRNCSIELVKEYQPGSSWFSEIKEVKRFKNIDDYIDDFNDCFTLDKTSFACDNYIHIGDGLVDIFQKKYDVQDIFNNIKKSVKAKKKSEEKSEQKHKNQLNEEIIDCVIDHCYRDTGNCVGITCKECNDYYCDKHTKKYIVNGYCDDCRLIDPFEEFNKLEEDFNDLKDSISETPNDSSDIELLNESLLETCGKMKNIYGSCLKKCMDINGLMCVSDDEHQNNHMREFGTINDIFPEWECPTYDKWLSMVYNM